MENYFIELQKVKCEVEKKNWLNYISWSDGWAELKKVYPDAVYRKVKNGETYLFKSWTGWSVECEVTVWWITHCADLAITDFKNQEIKYENIKSTDIQNTLQRAFAKAIAMHGIGLYVYRGEDFPEDDDGNIANTATKTTKTVDTPTWAKQYPRTRADDIMDEMKMMDDYEELKKLFAELYPLAKSDAQKKFYTSFYWKIKDKLLDNDDGLSDAESYEESRKDNEWKNIK